MWLRQPIPSVLPSLIIQGTPGTLVVQNDTTLNGPLTVNNTTLQNGNFTSTGTNQYQQALQVSTDPFVSGIQPGIKWWAQTADPTPRTTVLLQTSCQFFSGWFTDVSGGNDQVTFSMTPDGTVHVAGRISNSTPANRGFGALVLSLAVVRGNTAFTQSFKPGMYIHGTMDGKGNGSGSGPSFLIGSNGDMTVYNCDNTTAGQLDYYFNTTYNIYTTPGKYEGTGGGPH